MIKIAALILAAGGSSRMGTPKQLLPWKDTTLLGHTIEIIKKLEIQEIAVVVGAQHTKIEASIAHLNVKTILNSNWQAGLGTSIAVGISKLVSNQNLDGVLIALADQPLINTSHYNTLLTTLKKNKTAVIATAYPKKAGVPAIFPRSYFEQLSALKQDQGATSLLNNLNNKVISINGKGLTVDLDTPQDYQTLKKELS